MNIEINNLYGIKNRLEFNFNNSAIIFAPNGIGKTSIAKGFELAINESPAYNMEGNLMGNENLLIDHIGIKNWANNISILNSSDMKTILEDPLGVIRGFLKWDSGNTNSGNIPTNILENFINLYSDIKSEIPSSIQFQEVDIPRDNLDGIDSIMKIIENVNKISDDELLKISENYIMYNEIIKTLKESKIKDYKATEENIKKTIGKKHDDFLKKDFNIFKIINENDRGDFFGYKIGNKFVRVSEIYKDIEEKAVKNGVPAEDLDAYNALIKANIIRGKKGITKGSGAQVKELSNRLNILGKKIHDQYLIRNEVKFQNIQKEIMEINLKFCKKYNSYVNSLNREFLKSDTLKWKIKIGNIDKYYEKTSIEVYDDKDNRNFDDLNEYASEGQKRIIAVMLAILNSSSKQLVVLDDIISSLDTDNTYIFKSILEKIINDDSKNFILLTHSYTLLSKLGNINDVSFFAMENTGNECTIFNINGKSSLFVPTLLSEDANNINDKTLFYATVIREVIDNYILKNHSSYEDGIKKKLSMFKNDIEWLYRHFKTNMYSFKSAAIYIKDNYSDVIEIFDPSHIQCLIGNHNEDIISEYILNFNHSSNFKNLLDYISQKYVYSLRLRFSFEKNIYNNIFSIEERKKWDKNKIYGILSVKRILGKVSKEKIAIFKNVLSHNHLNNLRWTPIIESPLYKTKMYLNTIEKA